jgi:hypothetical protein
MSVVDFVNLGIVIGAIGLAELFCDLMFARLGRNW